MPVFSFLSPSSAAASVDTTNTPAQPAEISQPPASARQTPSQLFGQGAARPTSDTADLEATNRHTHTLGSAGSPVAEAPTSTSSRLFPSHSSPTASSTTPASPPTTTSPESTSTHPTSNSTSPTSIPSNTHGPSSRQFTEARTALLASLDNLVTSELSGRASSIHTNMASIEKQQKDVVRATAALRKENDLLAKEVKAASQQVKELGDVQNWAERMERDFAVLEETMRLVHGGEARSEGSWTGSESGSWSGSETGSEAGDEMDDDRTVEQSSRGPSGAANGAMTAETDVDAANVPLPPEDDELGDPMVE